MTPTQGNATLQRQIEDLGPWFHNLHLDNGVQTHPDHSLGDFPAFKWGQIAPQLPEDLTGWNCLDVGCNAGFYSFELARRGGMVLGIDVDPRYLRQARWAAERYQLQDQVRFEQRQVYDLARSQERFDLVLFMGVLYHLRYPLLGLDIVCQKTNRLLLLQSLTMPGMEVYEKTHGHGLQDREVLREPGWPCLAFLEHGFADDPTNYWVPNHAACEAMLRSAGMRVIAHPGHEFYLCQPDTSRLSSVATWNCEELQSAISAVGQVDRQSATD